MFRNLSIRAKIAGLVIPLLLLLFITSGFAIQQMRLIGEELHTVQTEDIPLVKLIADITVKQLEKSAAIEKALRVSSITAADESLSEINKHIIDLAKDIDHEIKAGEQILAVAKTHALTPAIEQELIQLEQALLKVDKEHLNYEHNVESLMQRIQQGESISNNEIIALEATQRKIEKELQSLLIGVEVMTEHTLDKVSEDEANALWGMILISIIAISTGMLLGILITRAISKPLAQAVEITEQLAAGDLSVEITSNSSDETGRLLQSMQIMSQRLHDMVSQIAAASEQLSSATDEVASVSTQIAGNIDTQTSHLNRTATAMHEMSATVRDIASNAEEAAASTQEADNEALSGTRLVSQVNESIQDLAGRIENSKDSIAQLDHQAKQVDQILEVITSIAEQTNLLALNAAIEAARAGTSGRGFAVVADEVRSLASRTQDSVSSIQEMVGNLQAGTENSVAVMQEGFRQAGDTVDLSRNAADNLTEISQAVNSISSMNLQIASATQQQSIVADEVNDSLEFLNNSALEVNSGARQMAQASEEIAQLSNSLRGLIQQFKLA